MGMIAVPASVLIVVLLLVTPVYLFVGYRSLREATKANAVDIEHLKDEVKALRHGTGS